MITIQLRKQKAKGIEYELARAYTSGGYLTLQEVVAELNAGEPVRVSHSKPFPQKVNEYVLNIL